MKLSLPVRLDEASAAYARQLGVTHAFGRIAATPEGVVTREESLRYLEFYLSHGLHWDASQLPYTYYYRAMHGADGRDEQIEKFCTSMCHLAERGVKVMTFVWALLGYLRTEYSPTGRGGTRYPRFDHKLALTMAPASLDWHSRFSKEYPRIPDRTIEAEEVWDNLHYFLERVAPVAEEAGIRIGVHPDDPPIPSFMGVARVLCTPDALQRYLDLVPSPNVGLLFCQGTVGTMADVDAVEQIYRFGRQGKIFHAHFRNPRGQGDYFDEVLPDEGDVDMLAAVQAYREVGYEDLLLIDHAPGIIGEDGHLRSFAFQFGYTRGLVQVADLLDARRRSGKGA